MFGDYEDDFDLSEPGQVIDGLRFHETCGACPEQYDVFDAAGNLRAYIRLRHGVLRVDVPDCGDETVLHETPDGADGMFVDDEQRQHYLTLAAKKIWDNGAFKAPDLEDEAAFTIDEPERDTDGTASPGLRGAEALAAARGETVRRRNGKPIGLSGDEALAFLMSGGPARGKRLDEPLGADSNAFSGLVLDSRLEDPSADVADRSDACPHYGGALSRCSICSGVDS